MVVLVVVKVEAGVRIVQTAVISLRAANNNKRPARP
jgi:hypothetical protein